MLAVLCRQGVKAEDGGVGRKADPTAWAYSPKYVSPSGDGADGGVRTHNLLITNQLRCRCATSACFRWPGVIKYLLLAIFLLSRPPWSHFPPSAMFRYPALRLVFSKRSPVLASAAAVFPCCVGPACALLASPCLPPHGVWMDAQRKYTILLLLLFKVLRVISHRPRLRPFRSCGVRSSAPIRG